MRSIILFFILLVFFGCKDETASPKGELTDIKKFNYYPSASALEFVNGKFFMMGDDARYVLVMNENLDDVDSLILYPGTGTRVPKEIKADLESVSSYSFGGTVEIVLTGSGSQDPYRDDVWRLSTSLVPVDSMRDQSFNTHVQEAGVEEINFEGTTEVGSRWLLGNRGNYGYPKNHLVVTDPPFHRSQLDTFNISLIELINPNPIDSVFAGLSGLDYNPVTDRLYLTL